MILTIGILASSFLAAAVQANHLYFECQHKFVHMVLELYAQCLAMKREQGFCTGCQWDNLAEHEERVVPDPANVAALGHSRPRSNWRHQVPPILRITENSIHIYCKRFKCHYCPLSSNLMKWKRMDEGAGGGGCKGCWSRSRRKGGRSPRILWRRHRYQISSIQIQMQRQYHRIDWKEIPRTFDVSVGLRVVWAGGRNSLVERVWPAGMVPVVISNRSNSKSFAFKNHMHLFSITNIICQLQQKLKSDSKVCWTRQKNNWERDGRTRMRFVHQVQQADNRSKLCSHLAW